MEAAETWAALLTASPAAEHLPQDAQIVLTDPDELRAIAAELDGQATERRAGLAAAGELPADWPLPFAAAETIAALAQRSAEELDEQQGTDPGYAGAPSVPGRVERLGEWLAELARNQRVVLTTDQASRIGELLDDAGLPTAASVGAARAAAGGSHRARPWLAVRRLQPRALEPAGAFRPGAVRRDPRSPPDLGQAGGDA